MKATKWWIQRLASTFKPIAIATANLRRLLFLAWLSAAGCGTAMALSPTLTLSQYRHTTWAGKDGAPGDIFGMAQTPDGLMWLGTSSGLMRFDGVNFEKVTELGGRVFGSESVGYLATDADGWLWIGFNGGVGCGRYRDGVFKAIRKCNVYPYAIPDDGVTWMVVNQHLVRVKDGEVVEKIDEKWGYTSAATDSITMDATGTLWASLGQPDHVYYLLKGEKRFHLFKSPVSLGSIIAGPDGNIWAAGPGGLQVIEVVDGRPKTARQISRVSMTEAVFDRDGALWGASEKGLFHVVRPAALLAEKGAEMIFRDVLGPEHGLSSNDVTAKFEDRQGNVWIGTAAGLERYSNTRFVRIRLPGQESSPSMAAAENGEVYASSGSTSLVRVDATGGVVEFPHTDLRVFCLYRDTVGVVWGADAKTLWKIEKSGKISATTIPSSFGGGYIRAMTREPSGAIWTVGGTAASVARYSDGHWSVPDERDGFPQGWYAYTATTDHLGRLWFSSGEDVMLVDKGTARKLSKDAGLDVATITSFYERGSRMWVGGGYGVAVFDGARFHTLTPAGEAFSEISGIVETADGELWLHGPTAAFRIPATEVARALEEPKYRVSAERFDARDGLIGSAPAFLPRPTLIEATDGRLWFASTAGLIWIDPKAPWPKSQAPTSFVTSITLGAKKRDAIGRQTIPQLPTNLAIAYTAVSNGIPEKLVFRYRLDGLDESWQDAGTRREAYYGRLSPGVYRFHVMASAGDGRWPTADATLDFKIEPAWFQTWMFRYACITLGALILWLIYRARVGQLTARIRWQLRIQQTERERIARDLHDTLLQGIYGLIYNFQSVADHVSDEDPIRARLEATLEQADRIVAEGRDRVLNMRAALEQGGTLSEKLSYIGTSLMQGKPVAFTFTVQGREPDCRTGIVGPLCDITREAVLNALRHGNPSRVSITLHYGRGELSLRVEDNGSGIAPEIIKRGRQGHFGLPVMKERAQAMGAALEILTPTSGGTVIHLHLKARLAYARGWRAALLH
jgi:signal transduction histidine kinase/ligand-binding sensor domain-containing protein